MEIYNNINYVEIHMEIGIPFEGVVIVIIGKETWKCKWKRNVVWSPYCLVTWIKILNVIPCLVPVWITWYSNVMHVKAGYSSYKRNENQALYSIFEHSRNPWQQNYYSVWGIPWQFGACSEKCTSVLSTPIIFK